MGVVLMSQDPLFIQEALRSGGFIKLNKKLLQLFGIDTALYLANLIEKEIYFRERGMLKNGYWFFNTEDQIENETTLSPYKQRKCRKALIDLGILKDRRIGVPAKIHFRLNYIRLGNHLLGNDDNRKLVKNKKVVNNKSFKNLRTRDEEIKGLFKKTKVNKTKDIKNNIKKFPANFQEAKEFIQIWEEWEQHKKEKKSPLTPTSVIRQINLLTKCSPKEAIQIINNSITNGYAGLFLPNNKKPIEEIHNEDLILPGHSIVLPQATREAERKRMQNYQGNK